MKKITIAFDVDGTLINNDYNESVANERIRTLLIILSSFKNTKIVVWSGGGELWARQAAREIGVAKYVDAYYDKRIIKVEGEGIEESGKRHAFDPPIEPDIAIDDIQDCELGKLNLIVKEK